jgi:hypothetical protein
MFVCREKSGGELSIYTLVFNFLIFAEDSTSLTKTFSKKRKQSNIKQQKQ